LISKSQLRELERCTRNLLTVNRGIASSMINILNRMEQNPLDRSVMVLDGPLAAIQVNSNPLVHVGIEKSNISVVLNHVDYELKVRVKQNSCGFYYRQVGAKRDAVIEQLSRVVSLEGWDIVDGTLQAKDTSVRETLVEFKHSTPPTDSDVITLEGKLRSAVDNLEGSCSVDYAFYGCSNHNGGSDKEILTYASLQERLGIHRYRYGNVFSGIAMNDLIETTVTDLVWTHENVGTDFEALYVLIPTIRGSIVIIVENGAILFAIPDKIKHLLSLNTGFIPGMLLAEIILGSFPFDDISSRMRTLNVTI